MELKIFDQQRVIEIVITDVADEIFAQNVKLQIAYCTFLSTICVK